MGMCFGPRAHEVTVVRDLAATRTDDCLDQSPPEPYPEYRFGPLGRNNPVYPLVRNLFRAMGLDAVRYGTPEWNPLGELVRPGGRVTVKPNLVYHEHYEGGKLHWVVTDPRIIRAVCDYALLAVGREGEVILGDAPLQSADWDLICERLGLRSLPGLYERAGYRLSLRDFRTMRSVNVRGLKCSPRPLPGDPLGYRAVNFGDGSLHAGREWERYRVTNYDPQAMRAHHNACRHEYLISGSVLSSSAVINLPKLKTHRKSGLTGPLKNMVGINGCKDWLPHHAAGSVAAGGDEYNGERAWKRLASWLADREDTAASDGEKIAWNAARRLLHRVGAAFSADRSWEGSWFGNDTLWRTILDLNRAAIYADAEGVLQETPQRDVFTITDAILAGEGEGPMAPSPVPAGCLLGAIHPLAAELAAVRLAGWPEERLRLAQGARGLRRYPLDPFHPADLRIACFDTPELVPAGFSGFVRTLRPTEGWAPLFEAAREPAGGPLGEAQRA